MELRVAVASEDGVEVQHFGHATRFQVYDLHRSGIALVEARDHAPSCAPGEERAAGHQRALELIEDCRALIVARIGPNALRLVESRGIAVYESEGPAAEALKELAAAEERDPVPGGGDRAL